MTPRILFSCVGRDGTLHRCGRSWFCFALAFLFSNSLWAADEIHVFGKAEQGQAALMGTLYDFKQTRDRMPTGVTSLSYCEVLDDFFAHGWNEKLLDRFYRVSRPLYTTQIFMPVFSSDEMPGAFGVEKTVQPALWIIHYKAQVSPPEGGTYRFVGYADDVIVVAVNGKTVLNGSRPSTPLPGLKWASQESIGPVAAGDGKFTYGDWLDLRGDEIVDLDIVIGDRPGGAFGAFLLVQEKGCSYSRDWAGYPILPIFQVAAYDTPNTSGTSQAPPFAQGFPVWKSYQ